MRRIIAGLIAVLMLCTTMVFAEEPVTQTAEAVETVAEAVFTDIAGHWAEEEIMNAYEYGIVNGDGDGKFRPDDSISRGEFLKILAVTMFGPVPEEMGDTTHWASRYNVAAQALMYKPLAEETAVNGTVAGSFKSAEDYDKPITRWEMAFMLGESLVNVVGAEVDAEAEAIEEIAGVYNEQIEKDIKTCVKYELFKGDENGKLNMNDGGTRAESVTLIIRMADAALTILEENEIKRQEELAASLKTYESIPKGHPVVTVEMENGKKFKIELYPEYAPQTVANFVALAESGFYNGVGFHRAVDEFMAQGGDPNGDGTGGAEHTIVGEFASNGFEQNTLKHERGVISMARTGEPNSASSQFFICYEEVPSLDGQYAAFGKVIQGMEVVDAFLEVEREANAMGEEATPTKPIKIKKITVKK